MPSRVARRPTGPRVHRWINDACTRCGLHREEVWVLDAGRPVLALVWSRRTGPVCVRTLPPMLGVAPSDVVPRHSAAQLFPGVPPGREPACEEAAD